MEKKRKIENNILYGVIPIFEENGKREFLLILKENNYWDFPRTIQKPGESPIETAKRGLLEKTGITAVNIIPEKNFTDSYFFQKDGTLIHKFAHYFIGYVDDKNLKINPNLVKDYCWCSPDEILKKLQFEGIKNVFKKVLEELKNIDR